MAVRAHHLEVEGVLLVAPVEHVEEVVARPLKLEFGVRRSVHGQGNSALILVHMAGVCESVGEADSPGANFIAFRRADLRCGRYRLLVSRQKRDGHRRR